MSKPEEKWLRGDVLASKLAIGEAALLRFSKMGVLGAKWDETAESWLFDEMRARDLFLPRGQHVPQTEGASWGTLGKVRLAQRSLRRPPVRRQGAETIAAVRAKSA